MNRKQRKQLRKLKPSRSFRKATRNLPFTRVEELESDMNKVVYVVPKDGMAMFHKLDKSAAMARHMSEGQVLTPRQIAARKGAATRKANKEHELKLAREGYRH